MDPLRDDYIIKVKEVRKSFKTVQAVKGVSMTLPAGKFVALLGPNGAGKTTLVEMIEGIQKPDSGEIVIAGMKWKDNEDELRRIIGISLQETRFIDKLRVTETLLLFASFFGLGKKRVDEIIELAGLQEKRKSYVVNLSGGQRQRLALGLALINKPSVLLLDEPTTGLDPNARHEIWDILKRLRSEGNTSMILTTHYMEEAETLCDHIIIMDSGVILKEGSPEQLLENESGEKTVEFTLDNMLIPPDINQPGMPFRIIREASGEKARVMVRNLDTEIPLFLSFLKEKGLRIKHMECRRRTLDDLFISLTGRRINE